MHNLTVSAKKEEEDFVNNIEYLLQKELEGEITSEDLDKILDEIWNRNYKLTFFHSFLAQLFPSLSRRIRKSTI